MSNLPDGCTQADLDRHLDGDERPCPHCGGATGDDCDCEDNAEVARDEIAQRQVGHPLRLVAIP